MKRCQDCRPPYRDVGAHAGDKRKVKSCHWLDWMVEDGKCPHCGGPVLHLEPTPYGKLLDRVGLGP